MESPIHPNDVAVILRPDYKEGQEWNGNFEILISGFGPVTMPAESIRELISMAMLIATTVPMMEQDEKLTERVMEACAKYYGEPDAVVVEDDTVVDDDYVLTQWSKTVGGHAVSKHCLNCFYQYEEHTRSPCAGCTNFNRWVSMNFLNNVDDKPIPVPHQEKSRDDRRINLGAIAGANGIIGPEPTGVKYDGGKPQWSLVPFKAMTEVVEVLTYGAKKYSADNWCKVPDARRRYIDAGFRHFSAYVGGEKNDPETGYSHLAHAMCCLLFLLAFEKGEDREQSNRYR